MLILSRLAQDRIYIFGGYTGDSTDLDTIRYSNDLSIPSQSPTNIPTIEPSLIPTVSPSNMPSIIPSSNPSSYPSSNPSSKPSYNPSNLPSNHPSNTPTGIPSLGPSVEPSIHPTLTLTELESTMTNNVNTYDGNNGGSNTNPDSLNNNDITLSVTTEAAIVIIVGLILVCFWCFAAFLFYQKHSEKKQIKLEKVTSNSMVNRNVNPNTNNDGLNNTNSLINTNSNVLYESGENVNVNANVNPNVNDCAAALELVRIDNDHNKNGNLPKQPKVGTIIKTSHVNLGEQNEDADNDGERMSEGITRGNINKQPGDGLAGLQGTGAIEKKDWTKWDEDDVIDRLKTELKNFGFKNDTISDFAKQFSQLHITGVILNIWLNQVNGNVNLLTQKFQSKLSFAKSSMVWDVVIQAMISLKK